MRILASRPKQALREMIAFLTSRTTLAREHAYQFCSLAMDLRITQLVNGVKGVHAMVAKNLVRRAPGTGPADIRAGSGKLDDGRARLQLLYGLPQGGRPA